MGTSRLFLIAPKEAIGPNVAYAMLAATDDSFIPPDEMLATLLRPH